MPDVDPAAAVSNLGIQPLTLEPGDVIEGAVLLLKVGNATDGSSLHRVISPGLSHWEAVGMTLDASDALRSAGWVCEDDDL